jgi:glycosyltransferase involved in cell wall biosynthesis
MRTLYFLLPGLTRPFGGGGLWAELKTVQLARQICPVEIVTYRQREPDCLFLEDILTKDDFQAGIFVVSWGFDVPKLVKRLGARNLLYHAHSAGYSFHLPPRIPIVTVSRNTMGYWGEKSPNSLLYYLPNQIGDEFYSSHLERDIDVLVQGRKSSKYLLEKLVPALRSRCRVKVLDGFVEDLAGLFNRSKVYLYDSAEYWAVSGVTEGFGLPPMEALACGCAVFSSVNSALADYLDPGFNCQKIGGYSLQYDIDRILATVANFPTYEVPESFFSEYRSPQLLKRLAVILREINEFFDSQKHYRADIEGLDPWRLKRLWFERSLTKIYRKIRK